MWGREAALRIFPRSPHRPEGLGQRVCGQRGNPRLHQRILLSTRSALGPVPHCVPTQTVTEPLFPGTRGWWLPNYVSDSGTEMASTAGFSHSLNLKGHCQ